MQRLIQVVLVDDTEEVRELMRLTLEFDPRFAVVGEAADGREAVELAAKLQPDAVLLDLAMPVLDGREALPLIREVAPATAVVVYTAHLEAAGGDDLLRAGAAGVLLKTSRPREVADYLWNAVAAADSSVSPGEGSLTTGPSGTDAPLLPGGDPVRRTSR